MDVNGRMGINGLWFILDFTVYRENLIVALQKPMNHRSYSTFWILLAGYIHVRNHKYVVSIRLVVVSPAVDSYRI